MNNNIWILIKYKYMKLWLNKYKYKNQRVFRGLYIKIYRIL